MWRGIAGQEGAVERFGRTLSRGRLASTYLLVGRDAESPQRFARSLAQCLLCTETDDAAMDACERCESCRLLTASSHPDLLTVAKPADRASLPIRLLIGEGERRGREGLCHDIALRPALSGRRVAIIEDADFFSIESANCLLKTLEEPPPRSLMLLCGQNEARILPTIRSRCQLVRLAPSEPTASSAETDPEEARAIEAAAAKVRAALADEPIDAVGLLKSVDPLISSGGTAAAVKRARLERVLSAAGAGLRDAMLDEARLNRHASPEAERIVRRLDATLEALEHVERNANSATLLQAWAERVAEG